MSEPIAVSKDIIGDEEVNAVNARDLHCFLESRQDFSTWIKNRIEKYNFKKNKDYLLHKVMEQHASGAKYKIEYALTLGMAKELCMVENNDKGGEARRYFIEIEERYKTGTYSTLKSDDEIIALGYVKAVEKIKALENQMQEAAPKIEFYERAMSSDNTVSISLAAKTLKLKPNKLFADLRDRHVLYYQNDCNVAYQSYIDRGYFKVIETVKEINGKERLLFQTRVTQKGLNWLAKLFENKDKTALKRVR